MKDRLPGIAQMDTEILVGADYEAARALRLAKSVLNKGVIPGGIQALIAMGRVDRIPRQTRR
jgi:hypothetical protein